MIPLTRLLPLVLASAASLPAQTSLTLGDVPPQYMDLLRNDVRAKKKQIVTQVLGLTAEQGAKFWPLHTAYESELSKLNDERLKVLTDYEQKWAELNDTQANQLVSKLIDLRMRREKLLQKYFKTMSAAVGAVNAAKFLQIESQLLTAMDLQIAGMAPMIK